MASASHIPEDSQEPHGKETEVSVDNVHDILENRSMHEILVHSVGK
jgi:hypothetical protein